MPTPRTARFEVVVPVARSAFELVVRTADGLEQVVAQAQPPVEEPGVPALGAVPVPVRDADWLRRSVLSLVSGRQQAPLALEQLGQLRELLDPSAFEALWAQVEDLLAPLALTSSGYHPALGGVDPAGFFAELGELVAAVTKVGPPVFLVSGTLLGAVREGRPLAHDYDADLAVLLPADGPQGAVDELWRLKDTMREAGLLDEDYERQQRHHLRTTLPSGTPVDFFPAWVVPDEAGAAGGRLHVWPWTAGVIGVEAVLPLQRLEIAGSMLPVPHDPDAVLACNYGPGWRRFDPSFSFDWVAAREQHADYISASRERWERELG